MSNNITSGSNLIVSNDATIGNNLFVSGTASLDTINSANASIINLSANNANLNNLTTNNLVVNGVDILDYTTFNNDSSTTNISYEPSSNQTIVSGNTHINNLTAGTIDANMLKVNGTNIVESLVTGYSSYVDAKIADLIGGAPSNLDTLKEISDLLNNSDNSSLTQTLVSSISGINSSINSLTNNVSLLQTNDTVQTGINSSNTNSINSLNNSITDLNAKVLVLTTNNTTNTNDINTLTNSVNTLDGKIDTYQANYQSADTAFTSRIDNLESSINQKLTNFSYSSGKTRISGLDATEATITNLTATNATIPTLKATTTTTDSLIIGSTNVMSSLNGISETLTGIIYDPAQDITYVDNHVMIPSNNLLYLGNTSYNVKSKIDEKATLSNNNTFTGQNSFTAQVYTGNYTSLYNGNFIVNGGAMYVNKNMNMYGVVQLFHDSTSGNGITGLYRNLDSKNFMIDSSYFDNSVGGGVVFRLKDPNGSAGNYSDVLNLQPLSITMNQPITLNSNQTQNNNYIMQTAGFNAYNSITPTVTNPKTNGTSFTALIATISGTNIQKRRVTITCPISFYRSGSFGNQPIQSNLNINTTLNSITIEIRKNNIVDTTSTISSTFSETLPKTYTANKFISQFNVNYTYEIFAGTIILIHDIDSLLSTDTLTYYVTANVSQFSVYETVQHNYLITNTNITTETHTTVVSASGYSLNYSAPSYTLVNNFGSVSSNGVLETNNIITNRLNNVTASTIAYLDATSSIQTQFNNITSTLTGVSYDSSQDITTINNHVLLPTGNNLLLGTGYNVKTNLDDCITKLSGVTYTSGTDTTTIDNNVLISSSKNLLLGSTYNVKTNLDDCITKLSGITYTSGTDTTTIDNNVVINGTIKNQYGVLIGTTKYLTGTYTNLAFPCEENILCNLTTFTYSNPYTLVLPPITINNGKITIQILTNTTFVQVYPSGSTTALYDPNRVNQSSILMTPDSYISLTVMATSAGWVVTDYATNNNLVLTNAVSTNNLYMYGPTTISSYVTPTANSQIGYSFSGNYSVVVNNSNQTYALISATPFSIGAGTWLISTTANVIAPSATTTFRMSWGFNTSSTNATPFLNPSASNISGGSSIPTATVRNVEATYTYSESFTFTHSFSTTSSIYIWFYLRWVQTVTSSTYAIYYQCTRIA